MELSKAYELLSGPTKAGGVAERFSFMKKRLLHELREFSLILFCFHALFLIHAH